MDDTPPLHSLAESIAASLGTPRYCTNLYIPRYPFGEIGPWRVKPCALHLGRGYCGDTYVVVEMPALLRPGSRGWETWMSMSPYELESQELGCRYAYGHTVVMSLGMGWVAINAAINPNVDKVTVIEHDPRRHRSDRPAGRAAEGAWRSLRQDCHRPGRRARMAGRGTGVADAGQRGRENDLFLGPGDGNPQPRSARDGHRSGSPQSASTLMTQMYACSPRLSVFAEPPIIESLIDWFHGHDEAVRRRLIPRLRAALGHLGRRRMADEERLVLIAESEHTLDLPLLKKALSGVPWIYLFLPPETNLLSHSRQRGRQMIPYLVHPEHLGLHREEIGPALLDEYCAQMLEQLEAEHGRAAHYRRLPEYGWREAAERFKLRLTDEEIDAMQVRSRLDSKRGTQQQPYTGTCLPQYGHPRYFASVGRRAVAGALSAP